MHQNKDENAYSNKNNNARDLVHIQKVSSASEWNGMKAMPLGFKPGRLDVICAREKKAQNHYGNLKFREKIEMNLKTYSNANTKLDKSLIVTRIVAQVRRESPEGGFVKEADGRWYEVGDRAAREKVGQGMRDLLHTKYRSSHKSKIRRRKADASKLDDEVVEFLHKHCKEVTQKLKNISMSADSKTDAQLQKLFDEAQRDLLQVLKDNDLKSIFDKYSSKQNADSEWPATTLASSEGTKEVAVARTTRRRENNTTEDENLPQRDKKRRKVCVIPENTMPSLLTMPPSSCLEPTSLERKDKKEETLQLLPSPEITPLPSQRKQ